MAAYGSPLTTRLLWVAILVLTLLMTTRRSVSGEEQELDCESIAALKEDLVDNVLGREIDVKTKVRDCLLAR